MSSSPLRARAAVRSAFASAVLILAARPVLAADLAGTWEHETAAGRKLVLVLGADGGGELNGAKMRWSSSGDKLSLVISGTTSTYTFKQDGDTLVVSGPDLEKPATFTRRTAKMPEKQPPSVVGVWTDADGSTFEVTGDSVKIGANRFPAVVGADALTVTTADGSKLTWAFKLDGDTLEITVAGQKQTWKRRAPAPAEKPRPRGLVGQWKATDGTVIRFGEDGTFATGGQTTTYKASDGVIKINANEWKYKVDGDTLTLTLAGAPPATLTRVADETPPAEPAEKAGAKLDAATAVLGGWDSKDGMTLLRADGTGRSKDGEFKWSIEKIQGKEMLKFVQGEKWFAAPFTVDAEKLVLGSGPSVTLTRAGIAGVWVGEESTVDPRNVLSFTQYLILYKDGSIGYSKSEGYASRTQVTDSWERFSSGGEKGAEKKSVGTWKKDGAKALSIKLDWREKPLRAEYDLEKWVLRVEGMGKLPGNEGGSLDFKRR